MHMTLAYSLLLVLLGTMPLHAAPRQSPPPSPPPYQAQLTAICTAMGDIAVDIARISRRSRLSRADLEARLPSLRQESLHIQQLFAFILEHRTWNTAVLHAAVVKKCGNAFREDILALQSEVIRR